jgi:hypothetical protein
MLTEISQNSVAQEDQTSTLNLVQSTGAEVIVRNYFTLGDEATATEDWHIFSNGVIVKDIKYEKANGNAETREVNSSFTNYTYYPATPSATRGAGVYYDSFLLHLTSVNTSIQDDYLNPQAGATSTTAGFIADNYADIDADSYAESRGVYTLTANYTPDPSVPECPGTCGQPIYHTIGTSTATINATSSAVNQISSGLWLIQFESPLDLSGIHKHDKFSDSASNDWNIVLVDDDNDAVVVGNQEKNSGSPVTGAGMLGPWYNSLYAWEAAEQRDLTATTRYANGEIEMAECWPLRDTTAVTIDGWTTGENNYIKVYTPLSVRHKGKWTEDSYRLEVTTTDNYQNSLYIEEDYVIIDGLQILLNTSYDIGQVALNLDNLTDNNTNITIKNNILKGNISGAAGDGIGLYDPDSGGSIKIYNNIIYGFKTGIYSGYSPHSYIYNNTIYNCQSDGIYRTGGSILAKNNLVASTTDPFNANGGFAAGTDYNATDINDTPGVGDHNRVNQTFSFVDAANDDFHLTSFDTGAQGAGWNLSSDPNLAFSTDIDGEPRGGDWSIGADQVRDKWLNKVKFTFDASAQTIHQPRFLLQDFYPQSGKNGSEKSYVVLDLPLDETNFSYQIYDKISNSWLGVGTSSIDFVYFIRNKGAKFNSNGDIITIDNFSWPDKFTVSFYYRRTEDNVNSYANFWGGSTGDLSPYTFMRSGNDMLFAVSVGNDWTFSNAWSNYLSDFNQWNIRLVTDVVSYAYLFLNDVVIKGTKTMELTRQSANGLKIGNRTATIDRNCGGIIDEFKIYSEPILPFGAYYTGYEQNGNYSGADPILTFYWDAESEKARGGAGLSKEITGTAQSNPQLTDSKSIYGNKSLYISGTGRVYTFDVSNGDLFDKSKGSIGFWFYPTTSALNALFKADIDSNNSMFIRENNNNGNAYIQVTWEASGNSVYLNGAVGDITVGAWNWVKITWDTYADELKLFVNGQQSGSTATISDDLQGEVVNIQIGDTTYDWQTPYYLDQIFITNSPYSQEIPTAFGKSLRAPLVKVDGVRQKYGYDYIVSWTPDPSAVIVQYFKNVTGTTFEIGEGEGTAQVIRLRGNIRLNGGVRF